jgi:hypothetical protein
MASLLESLLVLDDVQLDPARPLDWAPIPLGKSSQQASLGFWLTLPQFGPQRVFFPAAHTIAERGGKASKRDGGGPGSELFLASTALMASGAQTVLLGQWKVGGQSTVDLLREFLQELPHISAPAAWQRSVNLAAESPVYPQSEVRVKADKENTPLTAAHPFFWAGYQLIDSGALALEEQREAAEQEREVAEVGP